jgi:hypothetical protein
MSAAAATILASQDAYIAGIVDVACERIASSGVPSTRLPRGIATDLLTTTLTQIGNATPTRHGLDAALDLLFARPDIAPLLTTLDPATLADRVLPRTHPRFAAHWTHIVIPAWEQHVALARAMAASAATPENAPAETPS